MVVIIGAISPFRKQSLPVNGFYCLKRKSVAVTPKLTKVSSFMLSTLDSYSLTQIIYHIGYVSSLIY